MALYGIGDTHFSESSHKPMDIFGGAWQDYRQKLLKGFSETLKSDDDMLIICGDFSWGMSLEETLLDFKLLDSFPGKKVLLKGNHDYWWETSSKMQNFFGANNINTLQVLHNNCIFYKELAICGTRGWVFDKNSPDGDEEKIFRRELMRLEKSLCDARAKDSGCEIISFLHYPPISIADEIKPITDLLHKYNVSRCYYGHLHGEGLAFGFSGCRDDIDYRLISADAVKFRPVFIAE